MSVFPVAAMATWAAVGNFSDLAPLFAPPVLKKWQQDGFIEFGGAKLPLAFYEEAMSEGEWPRPTCPCYLAHGTADEIVPFMSAQKLAATLPGAEFHTLNGADHRLLDMPRRQKLISDIADWFLARKS